MSESRLPDLQDPAAEPLRRRFLISLGAIPLAAAVASAAAPTRADTLKTQAKIVIAGGGAAGLTAANRLAAALDGASITVIDPRK